MDRPDWQWEEMIQRGTDYADLAEVEAYDARMGQLRDVQAENRAILALLKLSPDDTLLEIGAGTGAFALAAARVCERVRACDISEIMLAYAQRKAERAGLSNLAFHLGGFLTYQHAAEPVTAAVTQLALHHLPDYWKGVALTRIAGWLRPGGRLYLRDVVLPQPRADYAQVLDSVLADNAASMREQWARHLSREFSTTDCIMEGLLTRAGFTLAHCEYQRAVFGCYLGVKA